MRDTLSAVVQRLQHRGGPPARWENAFGEGFVQLGVTPLFSEPHDEPATFGKLHIVADARLDNREELISRLSLPPSAPDVEIIARAYERWGTGSAAQLRGDFAYVLWDADQQRLFAARDQFAIRPLYFHECAGQVWMASEPQALLGVPTVSGAVDRVQCGLFVAERYLERDETLLEGIRALGSGCHLTVDRHGHRVRRYWSPDPWRQIRYARDVDYEEHFRELFLRAVRRRLRGPLPVACLVSGGLDSCSVTSVAAHLGRPPLMLRLVFPDGHPCNERPYSDVLKRKYGLTSFDLDPLGDADAHRPRSAFDHYHTTMITLETIVEKACEGKPYAVLTGCGSDERLDITGAESIAHAQHGDWTRAAQASWSQGPSTLRALLVAARYRMVPQWLRRLRVAHRPTDLPEVVAPDLAPIVDAWQRRATLERHSVTGPDIIGAAQAQALLGLTDQNLAHARLDRMASRQKIELRHPFMDLDLIEFLTSIPLDQRIRGRTTKSILRRSLRSILPEFIRLRVGATSFMPYVQASLEREGPWLQQLIYGGRLVQHAIVRKGFRLAPPHDKVEGPWLWMTLTSLELWLRGAFKD